MAEIFDFSIFFAKIHLYLVVVLARYTGVILVWYWCGTDYWRATAKDAVLACYWCDRVRLPFKVKRGAHVTYDNDVTSWLAWLYQLA